MIVRDLIPGAERGLIGTRIQYGSGVGGPGMVVSITHPTRFDSSIVTHWTNTARRGEELIFILI